jgi:hypothetical protein
LSQEERDIYRITGVVNVTLPHWMDIGKPEQVEVVNSAFVTRGMVRLTRTVREPMTAITGHAGCPGSGSATRSA